MTRERWYVKFEDPAGVEWSTVVAAVGYSQAITFARDEMNREGFPDAYRSGVWQPVMIERTRGGTDRLARDADRIYSVLPS